MSDLDRLVILNIFTFDLELDTFPSTQFIKNVIFFLEFYQVSDQHATESLNILYA